jgi:hypothetical protein
MISMMSALLWVEVYGADVILCFMVSSATVSNGTSMLLCRGGGEAYGDTTMVSLENYFYTLRMIPVRFMCKNPGILISLCLDLTERPIVDVSKTY